jgi:uncharacterized protein
VDQSKLKEELDTTVVRCVNSVVNINTASKHLLSYVSGIGEKLAENIVNYRSENGPLRIESNSKKYLVWAKSLSSKVLLLFELKTGKPIG